MTLLGPVLLQHLLVLVLRMLIDDAFLALHAWLAVSTVLACAQHVHSAAATRHSADLLHRSVVLEPHAQQQFVAQFLSFAGHGQQLFVAEFFLVAVHGQRQFLAELFPVGVWHCCLSLPSL